MKTAEIRRVNWKSLKDLLVATAISGISMKKVIELLAIFVRITEENVSIYFLPAPRISSESR